jgi:hypothetical protein
MRLIFTVSKSVFKESLQGQLFYGLLVFLAIFLGFCVYISSLSLGEVDRVIANTGMLGISLLSLTCTILFGLYSLYQERERNELYVLLSRIPRSHYLLGRFFGTAAIIALFALLMGTGIFILTWFVGMAPFPGIFFQVYMAILEFSMLLGIGFFLYTLGVGFTLNSFLTLAVFVLGHSFNEAIESFIALGRYGSPLYLGTIKVLSYLLPNFDMFDFRLILIHGDNIGMGNLFLASLYGFFYLSMLLLLSIDRMNRSDI